MLDKERFYKLRSDATGELDGLCGPGMEDEARREERAEYPEALSEFYHDASGGVPVDVLWEVAKELHRRD